MDQAYAQAIMRAWTARKNSQSARTLVAREAILASLFPVQRAYVEDPSPAKIAVCGRRAGKSVGSAADLVLDAINPPVRGEMCVYIALTHRNAKMLLWPELKRFNNEFDLGIHFNNSDLVAEFPDGGRIWLSGADSEDQIEKFRGFKFRRVVLDECGSFGPHISSLVDEVIHPGLADVRGKMAMIGSPNASSTGAFFEAWDNPKLGWKRHHWTAFDNPFIHDFAGWLRDECERKGLSENDPRYQREWLGLWIPDNHSRVYRYDAAKNAYDMLPDTNWEYVLGVDLGFEPDPAAFVVIAFSRDLPDVYVVETGQQLNMIPEEIAERIKWYQERYKFARIVADAGGLGKSIVEEFRKRYRLPIHAAEKKNKFEYIELMNGDLATGRLKARRNDPLVHDWQQLIWDDDRKKEASRYPNHRPDACLYAWRESKHYTYVAPAVQQPANTDAYWQHEADRLEQETELRIRNANNTPWWQQ